MIQTFLSPNELEAFIALQYARGLYRKNHPVSFLYNKEYGIPIFPETMPRDRFIKILKYLRFDDKPNRRTGSDRNQFAPIRDVLVKFASMFQTKYKCNFSLTVDEQLMPVKSRCPFITFMPNKPDKYGIKFWVLAESVLIRLMQNVKGKGYNVTCDNFFTSLEAVEKLRRNKYQ